MQIFLKTNFQHFCIFKKKFKKNRYFFRFEFFKFLFHIWIPHEKLANKCVIGSEKKWRQTAFSFIDIIQRIFTTFQLMTSWRNGRFSNATLTLSQAVHASVDRHSLLDSLSISLFSFSFAKRDYVSLLLKIKKCDFICAYMCVCEKIDSQTFTLFFFRSPITIANFSAKSRRFFNDISRLVRKYPNFMISEAAQLNY